MEKIYESTPDFRGSAEGFVPKSITVSADNKNVVTEGCRKVVKAGTIITTPYTGLLYQDVDVTNGDHEGSLMYAGFYIDEKLPASASSMETEFAKHGLFPFKEGKTVRPEFGSVGLTKLDKPTISESTGTITITEVTNAVGYRIYDGNKTAITTITTKSYTAPYAGDYYVQAMGDNVNYADSELSTKVTVSK